MAAAPSVPTRIKLRLRGLQASLRNRLMARRIRQLRYDTYMLECQISIDKVTLMLWQTHLQHLERLQRLHQFEEASRIKDAMAGQRATQE